MGLLGLQEPQGGWGREAVWGLRCGRQGWSHALCSGPLASWELDSRLPSGWRWLGVSSWEEPGSVECDRPDPPPFPLTCSCSSKACTLLRDSMVPLTRAGTKGKEGEGQPQVIWAEVGPSWECPGPSPCPRLPSYSESDSHLCRWVRQPRSHAVASSTGHIPSTGLKAS